MRTTILAFVIAALAACDMDDAWEQQPWYSERPNVTGAPVAGAPPAGDIEFERCQAPHPTCCKSGYIRAIAADTSTVRCQHMDGCGYSSDPCVYGVPVGDPETVVLCVVE